MEQIIHGCTQSPVYPFKTLCGITIVDYLSKIMIVTHHYKDIYIQTTGLDLINCKNCMNTKSYKSRIRKGD